MNLYKYTLDKISKKLGYDIILTIPKNSEFGDFSTNVAMARAKELGKNPRELPTEFISQLSDLDFIENLSIAGPGFINVKIKNDFIWESAFMTDVEKPEKIQTIVMDYGSYNVAKSLHIGHLRTGIVGDTLNRITKYLGHKTVSYNHIGDWGRPMGLVIAYIKRLHPEWPFFQDDFNADNINAADYQINPDLLDSYYPAASNLAKEDEEFLNIARQITADFQNGHPGYTALYNIFLKISLDAMDDIITQLNMMPFDKTLGERNASLYVDDAEKILRGKNLLIMDDGAEIIPLKTEDDNAPMPPFIFKNSRGATTYGATDIGAVLCRLKNDNPDFIWYLTDARQQLHFKQVFRVSDMAGIFPSEKMEHLYFGTINGPGGVPFKTRDGEAAGLKDIISLINSAVEKHIMDAGKELDKKTVDEIALAALKFADLSHDVKSDYIFDTDIVTSFEGRTGPYILYTAVRLNSVLDKADEYIGKTTKDFDFNDSERALLMQIMDFHRVIQNAFDNRSTDILANYTYDLCQMINTFYHNSPILKEGVDDNLKIQRVQITKLALDTLSTAIDLMGLKIPSKM